MDGEKEWPWYDFTLEKGDTWTIEAESPLSRHGEEIEVIVSNVDTITIGGKSRKRISFQGYYSWVEGLGDMESLPFHTFYGIPTCPCGDDMHYYRVNGDFVFKASTYWGLPIVDPFIDGNYIPFIKEADWTYYDAAPSGTTIFPRYHLAANVFNSEGVYMNDNVYYWLYRYEGCDFDESVSRQKLVLVREENQKVYVLDSIDGKYVDKLLYDFTLEVGDTLRMDEGSYYHRPEDGDDWNAIPGRKRCGDRMYRKNDPYGELDPYSGFEVIGIDSIVVDGQKRKAITWNNGNTWVVGLGEISEYPLAQFYMDYTTCITPPFYLLYQKANGEYSYEVLAEHDFTPDPCVSGIVENKSSSLRIAHTSDALIVTLPGTGYRLAELTEMTGRLAWCAYLDGEAGEVTIPTATLSPGAYIVTLSNDRGERITQKVMIQ